MKRKVNKHLNPVVIILNGNKHILNKVSVSDISPCYDCSLNGYCSELGDNFSICGLFVSDFDINLVNFHKV